MMYYNALPAILCQRAVLNLGYLIVFFVPCMCGIICFEKVIHGGVSTVGLPILIASLFGNAALRSFFVLTLSLFSTASKHWL
ncbi:hypothetical protein V1524DRAFT_438837 [Lipomyces starkeyi]